MHHDNSAPQHHQDTRADRAAGLGALLPPAGAPVSHPVPLPEQGQGPHEAHHAGVPADGTGEGRAGVWRPRRRGAGGYAAQGARAVARDPQSVHSRHQLRGDRRRALHVDADERRAQQRASKRLPRPVRGRDPPHRHADVSRPLVRQARPRSSRLEHRSAGAREFGDALSGTEHALALHGRGPHPVRVHAPGRCRDGVHERRVRGHPRRRGPKRRLHAADYVPQRSV